MNQKRSVLRYLLIAAILLVFLLWSALDHFSIALPIEWTEPQTVVAYVKHAGLFGPLVITLGLAAAIVFSPLPSAPIAMAAGAAYGHYEGTLYVFAGSLVGASVAFGIARVLGFDAAHRWLEQRFPSWKLGDQRRLMWLILITRLMPFVSFDLVSYAAGVTALSYGRFLLATAVGILPASFLLAHFGAAAMEQSLTFNLVIILLLFVFSAVWRLRSGKG